MYVHCAYLYFDAFVSIITVRLSLKLYIFDSQLRLDTNTDNFEFR